MTQFWRWTGKRVTYLFSGHSLEIAVLWSHWRGFRLLAPIALAKLSCLFAAPLLRRDFAIEVEEASVSELPHFRPGVALPFDDFKPLCFVRLDGAKLPMHDAGGVEQRIDVLNDFVTCIH